MNSDECRRRLAAADVARLATIGRRGPHIVPIVFATAGDVIFTAVDHKPKQSPDLTRLRNIAQAPAVAVLVDHYEDNWERLWWVRADGMARVISGPEAMEPGITMLSQRYRQYREVSPQGPLIRIEVDRWSGWAATPAEI